MPMQIDRYRSPIRRMPVAAILALALVAGLTSSIALSARTVGPEALQWAGWGLRTPARFMWFFRDRLNARFGAFTGLSAGWFWICWDVFGQSPTAKVAIGSDGWMFLRDEGEPDDVRGLLPWTEGELFRWLSRLEEWCEAARSRNLPLVIAIAPNKSSMLQRHLQVDEVAPFERTRYGELLEGRDGWSQGLQIAWLDLHAVIEACGSDASYFRTDTHWNYHGTDCAADAIADRLGRLGIARVETSQAPIREVAVDGGDLARMLGVATRFGERIEVPDRIPLIGSIEDLQQLPPPPSIPSSPATPRVLVVHDSFGMILRDPLSARLPGCVYEKGTPAVMTGADFLSILERESPEAVVIVFVERRLTEAP